LRRLRVLLLMAFTKIDGLALAAAAALEARSGSSKSLWRGAQGLAPVGDIKP
jgi:hypothetical protein